jgi:hypothetical protein
LRQRSTTFAADGHSRRISIFKSHKTIFDGIRPFGLPRGFPLMPGCHSGFAIQSSSAKASISLSCSPSLSQWIGIVERVGAGNTERRVG